MTKESTLLNLFESNAHQSKAWDMLQEIGLPHKKSEYYKFTPIVAALEKAIEWDAVVEPIIDKTLIYNEKGTHLIFINGVLDIDKSTILPDLNYKVSNPSEGKHDPFSLLNESMATNEVILQSGSEHPVFIYHFNSISVSNPRIKVEIKDGHTFKIYEKLIPTTEIATFTNSYIEYNLGKNAFGYHTKIQNYHDNAYSHETVYAKVLRDSQFYSNTFSFEGALVRNNLTINLEDENCEGHMYGIFLLDKKSHVDNNTSVDHKKPNSFSNELYKGILDEKSTGIFNGKIYVRPDAQKTNAFQSNNNVLLSENATLHTKPQLEIWADDVKCSHGCTSGQLDEEAIFYLRARGINEKSAKGMILNAFALEAIDHIGNDCVENEIKELIEEKLS